MSADIPKTKPTTRSSLRHSLNLASVGKALGFADPSSSSSTHAKEPKNTKKAKDTASRRNSALIQQPLAAPRASMGDPRPPSQRTATPEAKTTTRRRVSTSSNRPGSADEAAASKTAEATISPSQPISISGRAATLRPRNLNASATSASALPKYRPKSAALEQPSTKPPSPVSFRAGTRRRLSTSDDEKRAEQQNRPVGGAAVTAEKKHERPISPLPQRAALTANLTNSLNASPNSSPTKPKAPISATKTAPASPSRPNKIVKTSAATTTAATTAPRRPASSTPKGSTQKTSGLKGKLGLSGRASASVTPSNGRRTDSPLSRDSPSPLAHRSRPSSTKSLASSSAASSSASMSASGVGNMSHISEANSADEDDEDDDEDIELLLAPVAALSAPTPAMPRIQGGRKRLAPQTPTRPGGGLPSRADMSYLSPLPPDESSPAPNQTRKPKSQSRPEKAMRGSILSWEQLANEASVTLGEDEFGRMLSDIPAPFRSGAASPSLSSQMSGLGAGGGSMPNSPLLLSTAALDASPGAYGSISQVLLPDVTPSPAAYLQASARFSLAPPEGGGGAATMLRLQLAAAERQAAEREAQIRALEEELHELARAGARQAEEAAAQIAYMERQYRAERVAAAAAPSPRVKEKANTLPLTEVERMLGEARQAHEQEVQRVWEEAQAARAAEVEREAKRGAVQAAAQAAEACWGAVHSTCAAELDVVRDERAVLSLLLVQLDGLAKGICA
ncbi:hypothetical protein BJ912DRAFT_842150 [Pholiota molesta]|nr:hypothetical protein BJ912DRAFT_842150 [Pholiota molesta]